MVRTVLAARPKHLVHISIVGCDSVPLMVVPKFRFQPIDQAEVALELASLALRDPARPYLIELECR